MPGGIWAIDDPRNRLPLGTDKVRAGIGGLLDDYVASQDADRDERNQMAMAGATRLPDEGGQSPLDRIRGMLPAMLGGQRGAISPMQPRPGAPVPLGGPRLQPTPGFNPHAGGGSLSELLGQPDGPDAVQSARDSYDAGGGGGDFPRETSASRDATNMTATPLRGGEGDFPPVTIEGRKGSRYSVDPMRSTRMKVAGERMEAGVKADTQRGNQDQQIASLVAAGMPEDEARARVLTNTVKYDEQYGPQRAQGLTYDQRVALEQLKGEQRQAAIRLQSQMTGARQAAAYAQKAGNPAEAQRLELRAQELEVRWATLLANVTKAGTTEREPTGVDRSIEESTPEGRARLAAKDKRIGEARGELTEQRGGIKKRVTDSAPRKAPRARADELAASGKTKQQIYQIMTGEGYKVKKPQ